MLELVAGYEPQSPRIIGKVATLTIDLQLDHVREIRLGRSARSGSTPLPNHPLTGMLAGASGQIASRMTSLAAHIDVSCTVHRPWLHGSSSRCRMTAPTPTKWITYLRMATCRCRGRHIIRLSHVRMTAGIRARRNRSMRVVAGRTRIIPVHRSLCIGWLERGLGLLVAFLA